MGRSSYGALLLALVIQLGGAAALAGDWLSARARSEATSLLELNRNIVQRGQESPYDEPIVTDRPDFTEASSTVGRDVIQIESGYTYSYDDDEAADVITHGHSGPEILLRYGINDWIEFRLVWNYLWEQTRENGFANRSDGEEDLVIETKIALTQPDGWMPESAVILDVSAPTGGRAFSNHHVETGINLLYSWDLTEEISFAGSTGHSTGTEEFVSFDRHNVFHQSASMGDRFDRSAGILHRILWTLF